MALFVVLLGLSLMQNKLSARLRPWYEWIGKMPLISRVIIGAALSYLLALQILHWWGMDGSAFRPIVFGVIAGRIVFLLLIPKAFAKEPVA